MPLKQDDEPTHPISEIQMLHEPHQPTELRRRTLHIKLKRLIESFKEYFGSN